MIYIFQKDFKLSTGRIIRKGDAVFLDDPNEVNEITKAVEKDKSATEKKNTLKTDK